MHHELIALLKERMDLFELRFENEKMLKNARNRDEEFSISGVLNIIENQLEINAHHIQKLENKIKNQK